MLLHYIPYFKGFLVILALAYFGYIFKNRGKFKSAQTVALSAIMAGVVTVATIIIRVPIPASSGYLNFGDTMVMLTAILFGPLIGAFAGGVGSALADLIGYPAWAPFTLIVKGLEGFIVGYIASKGDDYTTTLMATIAGGIILVAGYVIVAFVMGGYGAAIAELYNDTLQAVTGIVIGGGLGYTIKKRYPDIVSLIQG